MSQLSEGAFGLTFIGEHIATGKRVCVKQEATGNAACQKLFREEASILWSLHHESLVPVKDYLEEEIGGVVYQFIVMDFIDAVTLQKLVEKHGAVHDEHICWMLQCALKAFGYMHYHQVVHCDIKAENIMLEVAEHNLVIVDFGLAVKGDSAKAKAKGGTPYYLPPEFEQGLPPIPESDIYSLGAVGLFLAGGDGALVSKSPPSDMVAPVAEVLSKMVRRDPRARYRSAGEALLAVAKARQEAFGRSESTELLKLRDGRVLAEGMI